MVLLHPILLTPSYEHPVCCAGRRDGTAPGAPIKTDLQQALFTAGELAALLAGQRGIAIVQLWNGWDPSKGQPIFNPLAISMLEKALAAPGIGYCSSVAPGGVGLTAVVYADREPFASWARHLASFGCQANVVAGSAYYKLLIGQLLGYKLENVLGYVAASGEPASAAVQQQVRYDCKCAWCLDRLTCCKLSHALCLMLQTWP